jgi:hypothetical protein
MSCLRKLSETGLQDGQDLQDNPVHLCEANRLVITLLSRF